MLRYLPSLLLILIVIFGCSRKGDDELPPRSGDLQVRVMVTDEFGVLPDTVNIPLILSLYTETDSTHSLVVQSEAAVVKNHTQATVLFEDLAPAFFNLSVRINISGLPEQCPDYRVYVQEGRVSPTNLITIDVRSEEIRCSN